MSAPFVTSRRVEFHDTDMAGIVHFTAFFRYMEAAEHDLLRSLGLRVLHETSTGQISWPRVAASCDFRRPARFEDELRIEVGIARVGEKSITYHFVFLCEAELVAEGRITSVCCQMGQAERPEPIPIPDWIRARLPAAEDAPHDA